ncbi:hypothetical protein KNE206_09690 [Kitasatospora sp. NE20-6]|uniref:CU044_2847 family protein n=1 Tax=Kitasatospora sp. NE20-6 TaxID=2859066 RepID=UPI0034DC6DE4
MTAFTEVTLGDGTSVLLELSDLAAPAAESSGGPGNPDLPDGSGETVAVGRARDTARTGVTALRDALQPLGGVLDLVHGAVRSAVRPPDQVEVEFGIKLSKDLRLGIVGVGAEATLTVRASWRIGAVPAPRPAEAGAGAPMEGAAP